MFLIRYPLLIAVEKELHCVPTETKLKWFEREIRQENKGLFGERIVALSKICRWNMPFDRHSGVLSTEWLR